MPSTAQESNEFYRQLQKLMTFKCKMHVLLSSTWEFPPKQITDDAIQTVSKGVLQRIINHFLSEDNGIKVEIIIQMNYPETIRTLQLISIVFRD